MTREFARSFLKSRRPLIEQRLGARKVRTDLLLKREVSPVRIRAYPLDALDEIAVQSQVFARPLPAPPREE